MTGMSRRDLLLLKKPKNSLKRNKLNTKLFRLKRRRKRRVRRRLKSLNLILMTSKSYLSHSSSRCSRTDLLKRIATQELSSTILSLSTGMV
jgi:hypothetical protein